MRPLRLKVSRAPVELAGSMSRTMVCRVGLRGGDAVLKVTTAGSGEQDLARRELGFYRTQADRVPVRVPELLDQLDTDDWTVLLISAHTPSPPARDWEPDGWLMIASQLAGLHAVTPPDGAIWDHRPWILQVLDDPPLDLEERHWSRTAAAAQLASVLTAGRALAEACRAVPPGFIHGDCHVGNLLLDGADLIWADWQVTGAGGPAVDLTFLWGRAETDNAEPPRRAMIEAYTAERADLDHDQLRRSLVANELGTLLFGTPAYAHLHSQTTRDRSTRRLIDLIDAWRRLN